MGAGQRSATECGTDQGCDAGSADQQTRGSNSVVPPCALRDWVASISRAAITPLHFASVWTERGNRCRPFGARVLLPGYMGTTSIWRPPSASRSANPTSFTRRVRGSEEVRVVIRLIRRSALAQPFATRPEPILQALTSLSRTRSTSVTPAWVRHSWSSPTQNGRRLRPSCMRPNATTAGVASRSWRDGVSAELLLPISSLAEGLDIAVQVIPARVSRCSYRPTAARQSNAGRWAVARSTGGTIPQRW